jgi:hypothetical protein
MNFIKTVYGRVVDEDNKPIEFATVFLSDSNGKPIQPSKNTTTDSNGRFKLDNLNDTDYITMSYVGLSNKTVSVKDAINLPDAFGNAIPTILAKMVTDPAVDLAEVTVTAPKINPTPKTKTPVKVVKKDNTKDLLILLGVLVVLGTGVYALKHYQYI